ncbi:hypothetical protein GUITHDRAFT_100940 [Guillardia theta CCMP2712]|uniref:EF-hand domain-containing protein n=1 Tax=Guillardia theta (strain CCMP2712) TaxID=905079 RepID=L1JY27_GUITC|nr:hypothetical protein GUITHDRAFT_100940 [Guillardia theta CCMP2712]EKX53234.1 hypothetical protein GUITHDRAFT_100940 [Guillardia theta CCMP2712]|eukprot:XP_005840214.1 hypothetical protein GUITHDRAFT_100940 [Guillardia theta CCMP2712]
MLKGIMVSQSLAFITCPTPVTRDNALQCTKENYEELNYHSPSVWYTLSSNSSGQVYPFWWIRESAPCCRHCVWDLGYPFIDPIILASDRASSNTTDVLDCSRFKVQFDSLDTSGDGYLSSSEMETFLSVDLNGWLVARDRLNKTVFFEYTDLNKDYKISLNEWLVMRHFWSLVQLAETGPKVMMDENLPSGPLGGFYMTEEIIDIVVTNIVNLLLEQISSSKCTYCSCCPQTITPCPSSCPWSSTGIRVFNAEEKKFVLIAWDLDGSTRISLEEHYFRVFADRDRNGVIDVEEFYLSLYQNTLPDGSLDSSSIKYNFNKHDLVVNGIQVYKHIRDCCLMIATWNEVTSQLLWSSTVVQKPSVEYSSLKPPITGATDYGTMQGALFASWKGKVQLDNDYTCSDSFGISTLLDGFIVVVRSTADTISLASAVIFMVYSSAFVNFVCFLFLLLIGVGHLLWLVERKENPEQFNPLYARGVLDGAWFCIVTMTTVGYGDKVPVTGLGKAITAVWMLFGIIVFGVFAGQISSNVNVLSAEASISDVTTIGGFTVGVLQSTDFVELDQIYQFTASYCPDLKSCFDKLDKKTVSALLLPQVDVLTYFIENKLAQSNCGNPYRITGSPVLQDKYFSARFCSYGREIFAATYLVNGVNSILATLRENGFTDELAQAVMSAAEDTSSASSCSPPNPFNLSVIIPAAAILILYYTIIYYINFIRRKIQKQTMDALFSKTSNKTSAQIALYYGRKWKELARHKAEIRRVGGEILPPSVPNAYSQDDRLLHFLRRAKILTSGQTRDLQRLQDEMKSFVASTRRTCKIVVFAILLLVCAVTSVVYSIVIVSKTRQVYVQVGSQ